MHAVSLGVAATVALVALLSGVFLGRLLGRPPEPRPDSTAPGRARPPGEHETGMVEEVKASDDADTTDWDFGFMQIAEMAVPTLPLGAGPELAVDRAVRGTIGALLSQLPGLAKASGLIGERAFVLRFNPEIARGLADGSYSLMQAGGDGLRGIAVGERGTIVGHGTLHAASLSPFAMAACWQMLATVTRQKFLADIDKKLARLGKEVSTIQEWLADQRHGIVAGNVDYLRQIAVLAHRVQLGSADVNSFAQQFEAVERELLQVCIAQLRGLERLQPRVESLRLSGLRFAENAKAAHALLDEFESAVRSLLATYFARAVATQARSSLPLEKRLDQRRAADLAAGVAQLIEAKEHFVDAMLKRVPELKGETVLGHDTLDSLAAKHRAKLQARTQELARSLSEAMEPVREGVVQLHEQLTAHVNRLDQPALMLVQLDAAGGVGSIREVRAA